MKIQAQLKKALLHKTIALLSGVLIFAAAVAVTGVSYAWLSSMFYGNTENVSITAGTTPPIQMDMWLYTDAKETEDPAEVGWKEQTIDYTGRDHEGIRIPAAVSDSGGGLTVTYTPASLHLGTINNLLSIRKDNITYCRFTVNGTTQGTNLSMRISLPDGTDGVPLHAYSNGGVPITDSNNETAALMQLAQERSFLVYQVAVSTVKMDPNTEGFDSLFDTNQLTTVAPNQYSLQLDLSDPAVSLGEDYSGEYYIYMKFYPNLQTCARVASILYNYAPSILLMDWIWEIDVH